MKEAFLWVEKYRPRKIADCVLPERLKTTFQKFVDDGSVPNMLLAGPSGVGKTTVARALLNEICADYIVINGSMNGNIDTLRNEILQFASTISFSGGRKYVILDEADYLNPSSTQPALRNFMEEFSKNCGFILTCNLKNRIIAPLHSRCSVIDFKIDATEAANMAGQFFKIVVGVLKTEGVEYEQPVVVEVIKKYYPDWRRTLNELQRHAALGKIDAGVLAVTVDADIKPLIKFLKDKEFTSMRKWVATNAANDPNQLFRRIYDTASVSVKPASIPQLVLILADYQYKLAFVVDQEINTAACLTQVMSEVEFL